MSDQSLPDIPLPSGWTKNVKSGVLHVISLAHYAITCARGWAANSISARVRLAADNGRLKQEPQLLREEICIKDQRRRQVHAFIQVTPPQGPTQFPRQASSRPWANDDGSLPCGVIASISIIAYLHATGLAPNLADRLGTLPQRRG